MADEADNTELITWLENNEEASREWRGCRLRHLMEVIQTPEGGILFHGELSFQSFCIAPGSLDTSLSHAAGLSDIAVCHA